MLAYNVHGLLLYWNFIIVCLAAEADRETKVQNIFCCSIVYCRLGLLLIREQEQMLPCVNQHSCEPIVVRSCFCPRTLYTVSNDLSITHGMLVSNSICTRHFLFSKKVKSLPSAKPIEKFSVIWVKSNLCPPDGNGTR